MRIEIENGINSMTPELEAGITVAQVRERTRQALSISPNAYPLVNGQKVGDGHVLNDGDRLEFVRAGGQKGKTVFTVDGLSFIIYPNDHPPPHVHIEYQGKNALFAIADGRKITGQLDRFETKIKELCQNNRKRFIEEWNRLRPTDSRARSIQS